MISHNDTRTPGPEVYTGPRREPTMKEVMAWAKRIKAKRRKQNKYHCSR